MTVEDLKANKRTIEDTISKLIRNFEKETKVKITGIELHENDSFKFITTIVEIKS